VPNRSEIEAPEQGRDRPGKGEIRRQVEFEGARRARLGVPAFAGGFLYLLATITLQATFKDLPTVGPLQGVAPALNGQPDPAVSPRAAEVRYFDDHATALIAGSLVSAVAVLILVVVLRFLLGATRFRRPQTAPVIGPLILVGGVGLALLSTIGAIAQALNAHKFVNGHDFTTHAVEQALTKNTTYEILGYVTPLAALVLVGGTIALMVSSVRVGLQPRWMGIVGGTGWLLSVLVPSEILSLIPAFWMVGTGVLLLGRWPGGDPPAWAAGEARPWPSQAQARAERGADSGATAKGKPARSAAAAAEGGPDANGVAPEPVLPAGSDSDSDTGARRRRKRRAR
jgi:hypothetical protein